MITKISEVTGRPLSGRGNNHTTAALKIAQTFKLSPIYAPALAFGKADAKDDLIRREAAALMKMSQQAEVLISDIFRGKMPYDELAVAVKGMPPEEEALTKAYTDLMEVGLRQVGLPQQKEKALLAKVNHPSPQMQQWMQTLGLTADMLKTPVVDAHKIDRENDIPPEVHTRTRDLGLYRLKIPQKYGGLGINQKQYGKILEVFPKVSSALGGVVSAHSTIGSAPLLMYGNDAQKQKYLPDIARGEYLAAFGLTEPLAGTDLNKLSTVAELSEDGKHWKLSGEKLFITNTMDAGIMYVVSGKTITRDAAGNRVEKGPTVFIVELPFKIDETWDKKKEHLRDLANKGMRITPFTREAMRLMMIRGSDQAFIQMKDFEVPVENVLGTDGNGKIIPLLSLNKGRAGFGPYVTEAGAWFTTASAQWAIDREIFDMYSPDKDRPGYLADMKSIQGKIGAMQVRQVMMKDLSDLSMALIDNYPKKSVAALSAALKVRATEYAWENAVSTIFLHGGHGLVEGAPNTVELAFRDAIIPPTVEGVNPAMAQFSLLAGGKPVQKEVILGLMSLLMQRDAKGEPIKPPKKDKTAPSAPEAQTKPKSKGWLPTPLQNLFTNLKQSLVKGTPLFPSGFRNFVSAQFNFTERGNVQRGDALKVQLLTKWFAGQFGALGMTQGDSKMAKNQHALLRAYDIMMDLVCIAAMQTKLAADKKLPVSKQMSQDERIARVEAIKQLFRRIPKEMRYLTSGGNPVEQSNIKVGKAKIRAEQAKKHLREDTQQQQLAYLHTRADQFHASLN